MPSPVDVEVASCASWPAFEQEEHRGWVLRFAGGCTKRANSVTVKTLIQEGLPEAVRYCESFFSARGQPAIFRLLSFVDDANLDSCLAYAGYDFVDPSLVLCRPLDSGTGSEESGVERGSWLDAYEAISGVDPVKRAIHARILDRLPPPYLFAAREDHGEPAACGVGIIQHGLFGIFDVMTHPQNRRRGHGTELVKSMLAWAGNQGTRHAYVQVLASNARAIRLYEKLGFRRIYHYWYRVQRWRGRE